MGSVSKNVWPSWICLSPKSQKQRWIFLSLAAEFACEIQNSSQVVSKAWKGKGVHEYWRQAFYRHESKSGLSYPQFSLSRVERNVSGATSTFPFKVWRAAECESKNLRRIWMVNALAFKITYTMKDLQNSMNTGCYPLQTTLICQPIKAFIHVNPP